MAELSERLAALREKLAACEGEADALGLEMVGFLVASALRRPAGTSSNSTEQPPLPSGVYSAPPEASPHQAN
jgi:hypothetical protein